MQSNSVQPSPAENAKKNWMNLQMNVRGNSNYSIEIFDFHFGPKPGMHDHLGYLIICYAACKSVINEKKLADYGCRPKLLRIVHASPQ